MGKTRVGIIFGGRSAEHEVSLQSAKNILEALDKDRFEVSLIGIDKQGQWHVSDPRDFLLNASDPARIALHRSGNAVAVRPGRRTACRPSATRRGRRWRRRRRRCGGG